MKSKSKEIPLAWLQLSREKSRLLVAMAGIAFADMLMFLQMGFEAALFNSNTQLHQTIKADLVLISPQGRNIVNLNTIPRRRLYQSLDMPEVVAANPLYADFLDWKNPQTQRKTSMLLLGFNPEKPAFTIPGVQQNLEKLKQPDVWLFDRGSRGDYAQSVSKIEKGELVSTEMHERKITIKGLFTSGASFAADGNVIASDLNFHRIMTGRHPSQVSAGLIQLKLGSNVEEVAQKLQAYLPNDVRVLTKAQFIQFEKDYWSENTPIGFIFMLGTGIGFVVGVVIVYQILSSDVTDHLAEYATLKAMGYRNQYLLMVDFQEALILAILGYLPGTAIAIGLYSLTRTATSLPIFMPLARALTVLILTIIMCSVSGAIATRKLRSADPADIF